MVSRIAYRGPDDCRVTCLPNAVLAFARLSIVDPEQGFQPITSESGFLTSMCNGEIYNHVELRRELEGRGHRFQGHSDCEVVVHLYEDIKEGAPGRLKGQFALIIYDSRSGEFFAARDRFGIVPLFYTIRDGVLIFASEVKAILEHPAVTRAVDLIALDQILMYPGLISPRTMFQGVESIPNGHHLLIRDGMVRVTEYWDLHYPRMEDDSDSLDEEFVVGRLDELLTRAVDHRMHADVEVGAYLSGGLDSSLLVAKARALSPTARIRSFGVDFTDRQLSERSFQEAVTSALQLEHQTVTIDENAIASGLRMAVRHSECPLKETYNVAAFALSGLVRSAGLKAVIAGQGSDELFAGYVGYRFDEFDPQRRRVATGERQLRESTMRQHLWGCEDFWYERDYRAYAQKRSRLFSRNVREELGVLGCLEEPPIRHERIAGLHPLHRRSYVDYKLRLCDHLLADHGDRMALGNSVECRYPYLDEDVVDFVRLIPPHLKLRDFEEKYILKRIARPLLPERVVTREKFGWWAPGGVALLGSGSSITSFLDVAEVARQGYLNPKSVAELVATYADPHFSTDVSFQEDILVFALTLGLFLDEFSLPSLN